MDEDEPSAGSSETAEKAGTRQDEPTHQPGSKPSSAEQRASISGHWPEIRGWMASRYRLIVLLVILLAAVLIGFHYKSLADPGAEPARFRSQAPQYLHLYFPAGHVVSGNVYIDLFNRFASHTNHRLNAKGYTYLQEAVTVTVTYSHPVSQRTIVMTSSNAPSDTLSLQVHHVINPNYAEGRLPGERFVVAAQLVPYRRPDGNGQETYLATQNFKSIPVTFESNGSVYGHLPSVTNRVDEFGSQPTLLAKFAPKTGGILGARTNSRLDECFTGTPAGWKCFSELTIFSNAKYATIENLRDAGAELNSEQVAYMNPPTTTNNRDYIWRSTECCGLEPVFKLTDPTAADSQSKAAFTSGIAFGVAGAALIAVFQELPKKLSWPRRKRRRKSPPQDA